MILYMQNSKDYTRPHTHTCTQLVELVNKFNKVVGHKIQKQNSVVLLYTNKEQFEKEIKKTIPLTLAAKKDKILRNKLKQGAKKLVHCKLQNIAERNWKRQINGKASVCTDWNTKYC